MEISSPDFKNGERIPSKFSCDGESVNPTLLISGVSESAQSLALIMDDPDAPIGTFTHWILFNIDPKTEKIKENSVPVGARQGRNSGGKVGYYPPCPPSGTHRYFFKLYALDEKLELGNGARLEELERAMKGHIIEKAEIIGLYSRS
ncbi:MAG: YbhB/YbcL family Raf kinase inhibitor-like protein [Actinomycetota bacterium]|nr:YbhB/YbcL family Raf kinase inhibitor-like protein [Actinomycetota bacterium]